MDNVKDKIMSLFKTNLTKDYSKPTRVKNVYGGIKIPRKLKIKKQSEDNVITDVRKLILEKETIKERIIRDIKILLEQEEDYYKSIRVGNFCGNNYTEFDSNGDRNKTLSIKEYLDKFKPYLQDTINNLKNSDTWKIQLKIEMNIISFKDTDEDL